MTFVVHGDDNVLDQVRKQLDKIVTVVRVDDISSENFVERDLMLIKVACTPDAAAGGVPAAESFRGRVVDIQHKNVMIEISGTEGKVEAFIELMRPYGILELARTGRIAHGPRRREARTSRRRGREHRTREDRAADAPARPGAGGVAPLAEARRQDPASSQTVRVGAKKWTAEADRRRSASIAYLETGVTTERVKEDDLVVPVVRFTKPNGELTSISIDENTPRREDLRLQICD